MKKNNLLTVLSVIFILLPLATLFANSSAPEDILFLNALSGNTVLYTLAGILALYILYLIFRAIYTSDKLRKFQRISVLSLVLHLFALGLAVLGLLGTLPLTGGSVYSSTTGIVVAVMALSPSAVYLAAGALLYREKPAISSSAALHNVHNTVILPTIAAFLIIFCSSL